VNDLYCSELRKFFLSQNKMSFCTVRTMIDLSGVVPWYKCTKDLKRLSGEQCHVLADAINFDTLQVQNRIGSASQNAQVYRAMVNGTDVAVKIMLNSNHMSREHIDNEVQIAQMLSRRVLAGQSTRFPLVIQHGKIMAKLDLNCWFGQVIQKTHQRKQKIQQAESRLDITPRELRHLKKNLSKLDDMIDTTTHLDTFEIPVLVSELLYCDMNYLVTQENSPLKSKEIYSSIIGQIIDGLLQLFDANVLHDDLHFGNILLRAEGDELFAVIHDFGTSFVGIDYRDYNDLQKVMSNIENTKDNFGIGGLEAEVEKIMSYAVNSLSDIEANLHSARKQFG
jgi:hypothetical protein